MPTSTLEQLEVSQAEQSLTRIIAAKSCGAFIIMLVVMGIGIIITLTLLSPFFLAHTTAIHGIFFAALAATVATRMPLFRKHSTNGYMLTVAALLGLVVGTQMLNIALILNTGFIAKTLTTTLLLVAAASMIGSQQKTIAPKTIKYADTTLFIYLGWYIFSLLVGASIGTLSTVFMTGIGIFIFLLISDFRKISYYPVRAYKSFAVEVLVNVVMLFILSLQLFTTFNAV